MKQIIDRIEEGLQKQRLNECFYRRKNVSKDEQTHKKSWHGECAASDPIHIAASAVFAHEKHDDGAAIERRNREKIENAKKQIEREQDKEGYRGEALLTGVAIQTKKLIGSSDAEGERGEEHEREVGCRASERHQGRPVGMTTGPLWIIRSTGKTNHASMKEKETQERENDHAVRRTPDVRDWVKGDLAPECGRIVSTNLCGESMGRLVAGCGKEERDVVNESDDEELR